MRRALLTLAAATALILTGISVADAQEQQPPQPGPEHKRLSFFVGKWRGEGEIKPGPMGPGGKMTSTDTCEWFEGNYSVVCRYEGSGPSGPSKGIGIIGYNPEEKVYTYYGVDNTSMNMASVPKGTVKGDTWTYTDQGTMGGKKYKTRVTIKEVSRTQQSFKMEMQGPDGKWVPVVESRSTKVDG
jgi:hypothetical protein